VHPTHSWLRKIAIAFVPGPTSPLLDEAVAQLFDRFRAHGHPILDNPGDPPGAEVVLTSARFGEPIPWRESLTLTARRRFKLEHAPTVLSLVHARPADWKQVYTRLGAAMAKDPPDPADFDFPGLRDRAFHTLIEQGKRAGPIMAMIRLVQSQAMSIRNIVILGEDHPQIAYTFDLVGGHPVSDAAEGQAFYDDLMYRILTAACTHEITDHVILEEKIPFSTWQALDTPRAMRSTGLELGRLGFFTEMIKVDNLVNIPLINLTIASQYSEGCFATWEPSLNALVCTITGSARPVEKDNLTDDELAIITGIRPDGKGAYVRHVEGKRNDPPSSEAVEMIAVDQVLPKIELDGRGQAPVARSKLHGHRGVRSFDPEFVEFAPLDPPYYHFPVSCSTEAQANAIRVAFARSQALQNPSDPRQVVFTILPTHGVLIIEKWVPGKAPFEVICETISSGRLEIESEVPQGPMDYQLDAGGCYVKRILYPDFAY